ncbi:MAG: AAA family ATPase [Burkholderiales bacterium]|nr:AAA family ATPase [Burkholderiales bacterium]
MKCGSCSAPARDGQRFCEACGAALEKNCRACGATALPPARFCGMCGAAFSADLPVAPGIALPIQARRPASGDGERRQLTVLFADLVGSTTLSGRLDPEALRAMLRAYQQVCVACVERYGGSIHQYAGDGVLAYFGYPEAHDNDAERATLAGLDIAVGVKRLAADMRERGEPEIAVRIGVHTGLVVVGEMGSGEAREVHAIGETPNIAARIQGEATAGTLCVSAPTARLLNRRFQTRSLGCRPLKGVAKEIELFVVDAAHPASEERTAGQALPLIGRERELAHLEDCWARACRSQGQAVLVSGQGGIGKSRLLAAFRERDGDTRMAWRSIHCSPFYQNSALYPMIDLIERNIGRAGGASVPDRSAALRRALHAAGLADETSFSLIASLVGLGADHEAALRDLAPDQRRRRTLDTLIAWLNADARKQPLLVLVEDLHWIDASTRDLIGTLLERIADVPILLVLTFRPEFVPGWALHGHVSLLPLGPLTAEQSVVVAGGIMGAQVLPDDVVRQVVQRTDGVPLFVEELIKAIVEAQAVAGVDAALPNALGGQPAFEVPATLRDSLTARLDRLGDAKQVAQLASVLGREFDYAMLQAICDLPHADLEQKLAALNRAEIIHQRGVPPRSHYTFKHALIQEAAYDTLLKSTRTQVHQRAAESFVRSFPELEESRPELLAYHFSRALMPARAIEYWRRAGEIAVSRSGYSEAIAHLGAALEQLALLPDTPQRMATELALRVRIGPALLAIKGMSAPEAGENYERACTIADRLGDSAERFMAMWGDWIAKLTTGRLDASARRSDDLVALSQRLGQEEYVLQAHHSRWTNFFGMGDARITRADTQVGIRLYDPERHRHHRHVYGGHDPGVCACGVGANAAWLAGYPDEAMRLAARALAIGEEIEHPFSQSLAWFWATIAAFGTRDYALARNHAEALSQACGKHGFRQWSGLGMVVAGACRAMAGETGFGLKLVEQAVIEHRQFGPPNWTGILLTCAATAHVHAGDPAHALELLTEAIGISTKTGVGILRPEMQRLQTEVLLLAKQIDSMEAIARLEETTALARQQGALALEWRATLPLARLYAGLGNRDRARDLLRSKYAAFTEGFTLPDLIEGKRLLDELGSR